MIVIKKQYESITVASPTEFDIKQLNKNERVLFVKIKYQNLLKR